MKTSHVKLANPSSVAPVAEKSSGTLVFCGANKCELGHIFSEMMLVAPDDSALPGFIPLTGVLFAPVAAVKFDEEPVRPKLWVKPTEAFKSVWGAYVESMYGEVLMPVSFVVSTVDKITSVYAISKKGGNFLRSCGTLAAKELGDCFMELGVELGHSSERDKYL
jgi:hypothetical protein